MLDWMRLFLFPHPRDAAFRFSTAAPEAMRAPAT